LRRSRQVVFALTNSTTPNINANLPLPAVANGIGWAIWTIPSTVGETPAFIQSGVLGSITSNVTITNAPAAVCFNSVGRLVGNSSAGLTAITGAGVNCAQPAGPPYWKYSISATGADRNLQVNLGLGGQVHMCDPHIALSANYPEGCP
jgi:type IV fimbrial biogenesis protein FimT